MLTARKGELETYFLASKNHGFYEIYFRDIFKGKNHGFRKINFRDFLLEYPEFFGHVRTHPEISGQKQVLRPG